MNHEVNQQPVPATESEAIAEASRLNLTSALELARRTLPEPVIIQTLRDGLEESHIAIASLPDAVDTHVSTGSRTGRTVAEVIMDSKMTRSERRQRLIALRRAARQTLKDASQ